MTQREIYNRIWQNLKIISPESWSTWEIVKNFQGKKILELGPGNYPKTPVKSGVFVDISETAVEGLRKLGANAVLGDVTNLPFKNNFFELAVAIEVLEHIKDDKKAIFEIARVLKSTGFFLFSVPMRMNLFSEYDSVVGHERRYEIEQLYSLLTNNGFKILKYRRPSLYSKTINNLGRIVHFEKIFFKRRLHERVLNSSRIFPDLYSRIMAFLDKKGAPKWQTNIDNLLNYNERAIVVFCQKS